ncbi:MAG: OmpH family outer membrane protein, partial [Planctomycetota bacterium]|nr:OmpH family outer membrane protein [Planctomycetota bacterium]MDI6788660.1 OmpH family outer membrane protein [Planctomycetota bacterium]
PPETKSPPPPESPPPPLTPKEIEPSNTGITTSVMKIAVVNLVEVFSKYNKTKEYEKLLEKEREREDLSIKEIEARIRKLQEELELLTPGSELFREKSEEMAKETARRKYKVETWNNYIKSKVNEQTLKLYREIREAVNKYAADNNFTFIFKIEPMLPPAVESDDVTQQISIRNVLYASKSMDISEEIIKILNKGK